MKTYIIIPSLLFFLICSFIQMSSPAATEAASPQETQSAGASFLQVKATGLAAYSNHAVAGKEAESGVSHMVSIPVDGDLDAFLDFMKPGSQEQTNKKSSLDFRPVFGFHITLR